MKHFQVELNNYKGKDMKKHFQVELINFNEPNGYRLVALVQAEDAVSATVKAQAEHPGLFAISAEFLCETE